MIATGESVNGRCPSCGLIAERTAYDIGSGPELSCASCEWCWGANGQDLKPLPRPSIQELIHLRQHVARTIDTIRLPGDE